MKLIQALQWAVAHQDTIFEFLGELLAACWAFVVACDHSIKVFAKLADWTDVKWDNAAVNAVSNFFDALAASLDQMRRVVPAPRLGPSTTVQPITTKDSRAAAYVAAMPPQITASPMPPLESKRPSAVVDATVLQTLAGPTQDSANTDQGPTP